MDMKLFESLDENVFTDELKASLAEEFDTAVEAKSLEMTADKLEEKVVELEEKAEEYKSALEEEYKQKQQELLDQVDTYLEKVVDEFIQEAKDSLDTTIKQEKADMIIEAMDAMITATGADIAKITEAKDSTDAEKQLEETVSKVDELVEENIQLQKENEKMLKMGIISEMKEGLSVIQADKFERLADLVQFEKSEEYTQKLDTIKESVKSITESKTDTKDVEKIEEDIKKPSKESLSTSFSHLV